MCKIFPLLEFQDTGRTWTPDGPGPWKALRECLPSFKARFCEVDARGTSLDTSKGSQPSPLDVTWGKMTNAPSPLIPEVTGTILADLVLPKEWSSEKWWGRNGAFLTGTVAAATPPRHFLLISHPLFLEKKNNSHINFTNSLNHLNSVERPQTFRIGKKMLGH